MEQTAEQKAGMERYEADRARELAERRRQGEELAALARAVARDLPGTWKVKQPEEEQYIPSRTLERDDGAHLDFGKARQSGQLHVSGWPAHDLHSFAFGYGHPERPEANISLAKGPTKIAQEIARRVLPALDKLMAHAQEKKTSSDAYDATTTTLAHQLLKAAAGRLVTGNRDNAQRRVLHTQGLPCYGSFTVAGESTSIDLSSVPPEIAFAMARLLATLPTDSE
jgi:hypothetical protein